MTVPIARAVGVWLAIGLAMVASLAWARTRPVPTAPGEAVSVRVTATVVRGGETATVALAIFNDSDMDIGQVYIAGKVPAAGAFAGAGSTPEGSWFRGFEGHGTPLQSAVWLAERLPARGSLGPFTFRLTMGSAAAGKVQGWVHWQAPSEGAALSDPVEVPPGDGS